VASLRRFLLRLLNACRPANAEPDLDRELHSHLQLLEDAYRGRGLSAEDARVAAKRAFGGVAHAKDLHRDARSFVWLDDARRDTRYAVRTLCESPGFTAVAVLTLSLGIGATTAIFTVINRVLLQSLPVANPEGLVLLGNAQSAGTGVGLAGSFDLYSYDLYAHLRDPEVFEGLCAVQSTKARIGVRIAGVNDAEPAWTRLVSGNYFDVLGVRAALGRTLRPEDDAASATPVAMITHEYWLNRLHGDPSVVGSPVLVGSVPVTIVGVTPPEFYGESLEPDSPAIWIPLSADRLLDPSRTVIDDPNTHWLYPIGRLRPGITVPQAQARLTSALQGWMRTRKGDAAYTPRDIERSLIEIRPASGGVDRMQRAYAPMLGVLVALSAVVLIVGCANVANLLLARAASRTRERSIRLALGASRARLIRQSLTESVMLAVAGGAIGLSLAYVGAGLLTGLAFGDTERLPMSTSPDGRVLAFTVVLSCTSAVLFGLLPALRRETALGPTIKIGAINAPTQLPRRFGTDSLLIVGQVALSLVVLAAAGALARSLSHLTSQRFGFDREHVLVLDVDPARAGYRYAHLAPLYRELSARLNAVPGVRRAALSYYSPFYECCWSFTINVEGYTPPPGQRAKARLNRVSTEYFETLGIHLLNGRPFNARDIAAPARVAIVNAEFVRRYSVDRSALGRRFVIGGRDVARLGLEIVGVVADSKHDDPREQPTPMAFVPLLEVIPGNPPVSDESQFIRTIELRAVGDPTSVAAAVRREISSIDPNLSVLRVHTLSDDVNRSLTRERAVAGLSAWFGSVALALTCMGLYGLTAYTVRRRTAEIGIRMALGADPPRVLSMVLRDVFVHAAIGVGIGIPATFAAMRLVRGLLYGVSPADPTFAIGGAALLIACMLLAGYGPARHASRIEPMVALRTE
jgi:predicted permease